MEQFRSTTRRNPMGYTHYWTQLRDFTIEEWAQFREDFEALLEDVQHVQGIPLADGEGEPGTSPEITDAKIWFNGVGDDAAETFCLYRKRPPKQAPHEQRGWDFCKTYRRPYDLAVTAALCYLTAVPDPAAFTAGSDGHGRDFLDGLAEARRALPRYANILDIPMEVMQGDRWCGPWVSCYESSGFDVKFCVDGKGYVECTKTGEWYCFETHLALAQFLDKTRLAKFPRQLKVRFSSTVYDQGNVEPNIWNATGAFSEPRHKRIAQAQAFALAPLFPADAAHKQEPPAYVRPGTMPEPATRAYYFHELLKELAA
jgi:hypothetical protein